MVLTLREIIRLVGEGIVAAQQDQQQGGRVNTSCLKMKNPDTFNGKTTSHFNQWCHGVCQLGLDPWS